MTSGPPRILHCSFCGRAREDVHGLAIAPRYVAGLPVAICSDCAASAVEMLLADDQPAQSTTGERNG